jgi:phage terminase large subunit
LTLLNVEIPRALAPLVQPARYKAAYGGRGGAKSHFFAEQIVLRCYARKTRVACIREVQATIKDSVKQLITDKIEGLGLAKAFDIQRDEIRGPNGSLVSFKGMQAYNAENIKSLEDYDLAWVEEAQVFSERSLRLLRPTIRKPGSEIWFSWNPRNETDAVDAFFRGGNPPKDAIICPVGWQDNPWFPDVLVDEKAHDYEADAEMAEHVWGGGYEIISEASYFSRHLFRAEQEGRVGFFPHDPKRPVLTGWDLGVDDYTSIWFLQVVNMAPVIIDYYEASGLGADEILREALPEYLPNPTERFQRLGDLEREPYRYAKHFFPHDIGNREWGAGAKTRVETLMGLGVPLKHMHRGVRGDPTERINAVRQLLPLAQFNRSKRVMVGVQHLRRYSRKRNDALGTYTSPLHDEHSHAADALGEFSINCGLLPEFETAPPKRVVPPGHTLLPGPPEPKRGGRIRL